MAPIKVLVVEDDRIQAALVFAILADTPGFSATHATTLSAAIDAIAAERPDVVLLDLNLPDSNGLDTLTAVLRHAEGIATVVLSATGEAEMGERAIELGADEYLVKGVITASAIRRVLKYAVERQAHHRATEESLEHERALADFGRLALSDIDLDELLSHACRLAARVLHTRWAAFADVAEEQMIVRATFGQDLRMPVTPIPIDAATPAALALRSSEPVAVEDIRGDARFPANALFEELGVISEAAVAVRDSEAVPSGVLAVWDETPKRIDEHQLNFLSSLANIAGATIQRRRFEDALSASRADMAEILAALPDWVLRVDAGFRIRYAHLPDGGGAQPGAHWDDLAIPEPLASRCETALERAFATREGDRFDVATDDGRHFDVCIVPVRENGKPSAVVVCRDITDRIRAEARFRTLFSSNVVGVVFYDSGGAVTHANDEFLHMTGYSDAEIADGRVRLEELLPHERIPLAQENARELKRSGVVLPQNTELLDKHGSRIPVLMASAAVEGLPDDIVGFVLDQTPARQAQATIQGQMHLLNSARDAIILCGGDGTIHFWSDGATRLYGWNVEDAIGGSAFDLLSDDPDGVRRVQEAALSRGEWRGDLPQRTKDGRRVIVDSHWSVVQDPYTDARVVLMINGDITEKRQLEQQLLQSQRLESLGTIAGGVAHDLNNILLPVMLGMDQLRREGVPPSLEPTLGRMGASVTRAAELIRQMLTFARGHRAGIRTTHPGRLIAKTIKVLRETFPPAIDIRLTVDPEAWTVACDPTQLDQILFNLCVNARDAMPGGGVLEIACANTVVDEQYARMHADAAAGAYVMIRVADSGAGIPREISDSIFEPFFTTKQPGAGTGLGLATVRSIVRTHKGFMNVRSEPGRTVFKVYLPAVRDAAPEETRAPAELPRGHGELVLLIDDEEAIREITCTTLESYGYRVLAAADGSEGVALFAQNPDVAVVITDMLMPVMDGAMTIRALRRINPKVRVIGMSGFDARPGSIAGDVTLVKPFTAESLLRAIEEVLQ